MILVVKYIVQANKMFQNCLTFNMFNTILTILL